MSKKHKLKELFKVRPRLVRYRDLEIILNDLGFEKIKTKGSHVKFKHSRLRSDIVIPVHNNECKDFYKKDCRDKLINFGILK